jgi:hypothetical protein
VARGRDAADVAISTAFGPAPLARFKVTTEEFVERPGSQARASVVAGMPLLGLRPAPDGS